MSRKRPGRLDRPGTNILWLSDDHPAVRAGRSLWSDVKHNDGRPMERFALPEEWVIADGHDNLKLGAYITRGVIRPVPMRVLYLPERTTCSWDCPWWNACSGNKTKAKRYKPDTFLQEEIERECEYFSLRYPGGWRWRVPGMGDLVSPAFVLLLGRMLERFPSLEIWGFTARRRSSDIGKAVQSVTDRFGWKRFAVRFSEHEPEARRSAKVFSYTPIRWDTKKLAWKFDPKPEGYTICPVQRGLVEDCCECRLCWRSQCNIGFLLH